MPQTNFEPAANYEDALARAAEQSGIDGEYWDIFGKCHQVSADVQRRILQALGWDSGSFESIEAERYRRFEQSLARGLEQTLVISESDLAVPLNLPASAEGPIRFESCSKTDSAPAAALSPISCDGLAASGPVIVIGARMSFVFRQRFRPAITP